jgi:hypothetical protein
MNKRHRRIAGPSVILGLAALALMPAAQASANTVAAPAASSATTRALNLMPAKIKAGLDIRVTTRRYALCAASNITPSKRTSYINGVKYRLGTGLCPIVNGQTVYNASLQGKKPTVKGPSTLWSSFGGPPTIAQYSTETNWTVAPLTMRTGIVGDAPNKGMANFWGYPCTVTTPVTIDGVKYPMAMCAGPLMENPDNRPAAYGVLYGTDAAASATIPVGATTMTNGPLAGLGNWLLNPFGTALNGGNGAAG